MRLDEKPDLRREYVKLHRGGGYLDADCRRNRHLELAGLHAGAWCIVPVGGLEGASRLGNERAGWSTAFILGAGDYFDDAPSIPLESFTSDHDEHLAMLNLVPLQLLYPKRGKASSDTPRESEEV